MTPQDQILQLKNDLQQAIQRISDLERVSIQANIDPITLLYLNTAINKTSNPTSSTYSLSAPSGVAVTGSTWFQTSADFVTKKIFCYSGSSWIQFL